MKKIQSTMIIVGIVGLSSFLCIKETNSTKKTEETVMSSPVSKDSERQRNRQHVAKRAGAGKRGQAGN